ncbi:hypothetical protein [Pseudomonas lurida]|uniref:DUF2171 domain-containing protein n=1 Tax=Pseudomonas lurida TaxID=244566 RepID=A0ABY9FQ37_9PSED|nr:hypothetical protein [Pseudomonas lurida]WLH05409.1 hypothetical protein PSH67_21585 [Pseudomonas lurida]
MSHNFKPGDLALIAKADHDENIGRVVELLFSVEDGERYQTPDGVMARNVAGTAIWVVSACSLFHHHPLKGWYVAGWTQKAPCNLLPLRGDFVPVQQKDRELSA